MLRLPDYYKYIIYAKLSIKFTLNVNKILQIV